ncbi:hypothetical protein TrispH2_006174 [Trichoplax sp. H2]|uniref:Expressed protein n=1 Tax=Trichoplax adhaerens TaxID=10228 RepID=B3S8F5_TRIAD|nr:expressed protein [Trichoplax adhaerens]EDV20877.1 expressed protein [Trichoplax adhaerens]RDD41236.1 hypothetical protein TrispH2_006174 [Trichoplax sp. H2]|eukprot:XP_002116521.1 expressed protein [Trichoplax adhaerens]
MAVAFGHQSTDISLGSETVENVTTIRGDKAITESTIERIIQILEEVPGIAGKLDFLKAPYDALTCAAAYQLFCELPFVIKVPNVLNREPEGLTLIVWKRWIDVTDKTTTGFLSDAQLAAIRAERVTRIPIATVSANAWEAMERHIKSLIGSTDRSISWRNQRDLPQPKYSNNDSCCCFCTIS